MKLININPLSESVTFWVENGVSIDDQHDSYENIGSISHYLAFKFFNYVKTNKEYPNRIEFDADGDDYFEPTGTVNVYTRGIVSDQFYPDFLEALKHATDSASKYVSFGKMSAEGEKGESGGRTSASSGESVHVVRVPVTKNDASFDDADAPEMNISNYNARSLLQVLGIDDDELGGSIDYKDIPRMKMKIHNLRGEQISNATREPSETGGENTAKIIDKGLSSAQINNYLDRLLRILDYAMKKKSDVLYG